MAKKNPIKKAVQNIKSKLLYDNLHELFEGKLQSLYDIEQQLIKTLPKLSDNASSDELKVAFNEHLSETKEQARRLEHIFDRLGMKKKTQRVEGIRGIAEDGSWIARMSQEGAVRDAALIAAAQYAEHYEIAGYRSACEWARLMGHDEAAQVLEQTLKEEETASRKLSDLAEGGIDQSANVEEAEVEAM